MRDYSFQLSAGGQSSRPVRGRFVFVKSASDSIRVKVEDFGGSVLADMLMTEGSDFSIPAPLEFQNVRVENETGAAVTATLVIGYGEASAPQVLGQVTLTKASQFVSSADVSIGAGVAVQVAASNPDRVSIEVGNLAANTETLRVGDSGSGAANGRELSPGEKFSFDGTAALYVYNPGAAAQSVTVVETRD